MKYVLFLQNLGLTHAETRNLLEKANCHYEPVWDGEFDADKIRYDVEVLVTSKHKVDASSLRE